ncbi:(2Fe-2S)-binding protein [Streptomyces sp. UH6]|uniref:(2Fe-2S)-binding protein n=1 Tax=Streptomyces sp. UH6 TaxID=2748379 RepID=UPI0015D51A69|nr:(2Fe-2S)-binding protein [Streptomyces sp. UH6]NYV76150.1 (2Fe-2S)-binding protein [Streptomyces sp. UH6]
MSADRAATHRITVDVEVDGRRRREEVPANTVLLDLLRDRMGNTGVKASCERGVCGACTTLIDGVPTASCSVFAFSVDGCSVETVAGQTEADEPGPVQRAFAECGGFQCGYCTPGMVMLTTALLREHPEPTEEQVREWISSNICRCTGYRMIIDSVHRAAELIREEA